MSSWRLEDPVLIFAVMMLLLLIAPLFFARLRLPSILGLIIAGILVGPYGLQWFALDSTFELLGKVGLLYLMFLAGLEIEFEEFIRHRRESILFGFLTFLIPQLVGTFGARVLLNLSWPTSILMASMFASHTLIPYPIVARYALTRHRAVATTVGATLLTDTAALLVLAIIAESIRAQLSWGFWLRQGALLALLVGVGIWALPRLGYVFFRLGSSEESQHFIFVLAVVFGMSYLARLCGVEPIIGAFLAGLSIGRLIPPGSPLMNRLEFTGHALFIPFFLLSVGMRIDLRAALFSWASWSVSLFMVGTVMMTKWLAAALAAACLRYTRDERRLMYGLSVNQAAATLAAVLVGRQIGLFDDAVLNGTILMILVTCLRGPWVTQKAVERLAQFSAPSIAPSPGMASRILVALGNAENAAGLIDLALRYRGLDIASEVYATTVVQEGVDLESRLAAAERALGKAVARAAAAGVVVHPMPRLEVSLATGLARAVQESRAGVVVMGWSRRFTSPSSVLHWLPHEMMEHSRALFLLGRIPAPLVGIRQVLLVVPPRIEETPALEAALRAIPRIAAQAELHLLADEATSSALRRRLLPYRTIARTVYHPMSSLDQAPALLASLRPKDPHILAILCARQGYAGWHPRVERLSAQIAAQFPDAHFVVIYPPAPAEPVGMTESPAGWMDPARIAVVRNESDLADALTDLLQSHAGGDAQAARALAAKAVEWNPLELSDGIVLLHGREEGFTTSVVFLIAAAGEARLRLPSGMARAVFLLIGPPDESPESHLEALARIARAIRLPNLLRALESDARPELLAQVLNEAAQTPIS